MILAVVAGGQWLEFNNDKGNLTKPQLQGEEMSVVLF